MAPHTGAHMAAWPPWHLARPVRLLRGPHASCHVASVPRRNGAVVPCATSPPCHVSQSLGPACHVISRGPVDKNTPLFRDFNKEIHLKITLKIQIKIRKRAKTLEIHISQNTTPFNLKFSPLDHKFLPF